MSKAEPSSTSTLSLRLWSLSKEDAIRSLEHPFVRALGKGNLPKDVFRQYIAQDAYYLEAFAASYSIAISKADGLPVHAVSTLNELLAGVAEEVILHKRYAQELGVLATELEPNAATLEYTEFLLGVAKTQDTAHVLAAMAPCSRLYAFLGFHLAAEFPDTEHDYAAWITSYSSAAYLELPEKQEALLDELGAHADFASLLQLYQRAMKLELAFFEAHNPCQYSTISGYSA